MVPQGGVISQALQVLIADLVELVVEAVSASGLHVQELGGLDEPGL